MKEKLLNWLKEYKENTGLKKAILGISGGKDSTVAAMLLVKALGKENVIGVLMPNGNQKDISDSYTVVKTLGIPHYEVNIEDSFKGIITGINKANGQISDEARVNIAPRLRMTTLYTMGQTLGARVCGTGNASERLVGYFTKWGDGACDFNPLGNLTSIDVVELGLELAEEFNIPSSLIVKVPHDGLGDLTDEDKLGVSYQAIHNYIKGEPIETNEKILIEKKEKYSKHKLEPIPLGPVK